MTLPDHLLAKNSEKLSLSTQGEIKDWINMEAIGNSPHSATYLEGLKLFISHVEEHKDEIGPDDRIEGAALTLASMIAKRSEARYQKEHAIPGGDVVAEIEGITPLREVDDADIMLTAVTITPDHPDFRSYEDSDIMYTIHSTLEEETRRQLSAGQES